VRGNRNPDRARELRRRQRRRVLILASNLLLSKP
jgi:hypothetical protein